MTTRVPAHGLPHVSGESATHLVEPRCDAAAALLVVADIESAASSRVARTPQRSPLGRVQLPKQGRIEKAIVPDGAARPLRIVLVRPEQREAAPRVAKQRKPRGLHRDST